MKLDHDQITRPENIWAQGSKLEDPYRDFARWWLKLSVRLWEDGRRKPNTVFFKKVFGRQDQVIMFRHRNWVWHRPEAGWTLYVDKRGPAFHVALGSTETEAWAAWEDFKVQVNAYLE